MKGGRGGDLGQSPPQILAEKKAPTGSRGAPHYYLPTQIFRPCAIPAYVLYKSKRVVILLVPLLLQKASKLNLR